MTDPVTDFSDITILVPTANRPEQLCRFVRYYAAVLAGSGAHVVVADGSGPEAASRFDAMVDAAGLRGSHSITRYGATLPFFDRIAEALATVTTPFVMIAADDDFYFVDWIDEAVTRMREDRDGTYVAQVGNYFSFDLPGFGGFGEVVAIADASPERHPVPFLEGETIADRIGEVAAIRQGIPTIAWYALHRTAEVAAVYAHAAGHALPMLLAERYFTVAQAASGKTHFSPRISLARQNNSDPAESGWRSEPPGLAANRVGLAATIACTRSYLETFCGVAPDEAARLAEQAFANEAALMAQADRRRFVRRIVKRFRLRGLLNALRGAPGKGAEPARDPRLPQRCDPIEMVEKAKIVSAACQRDFAPL